MTPKQIVLAYWEAMRSNNFSKASEWLSEDYEGHWPQSSELIVGRENFTKINSYYPANGKWRFELNSIICEDERVVTDMSVTDGKQKARAITFHRIENGLIKSQVEFWPDDYTAPQWRSKWVKML